MTYPQRLFKYVLLVGFCSSPVYAQTSSNVSYLYFGADGKLRSTTDMRLLTASTSTPVASSQTSQQLYGLTDVQKLLLTAVNTNAASLAAEITRAQNAESVLTNSITTFNTNINNEIIRAKTNETSLSTLINNEKIRAQTAETNLQTSLTAVQTTNTNALTQSRINVANGVAGLNASAQITSPSIGDISQAQVTSSRTATQLSGLVDTANTNITTLTTGLSNETTRAQTAELANKTLVQSMIPSTSINANGGVSGLNSLGQVTAPIASTTGVFSSYVTLSVASSISASGTTLATATALTAQINYVATVSSAGAGVVLPSVPAGTVIQVINRGANTLYVYPNTTSEQIESQGAGNYQDIQSGSTSWFTKITPTLWSIK